MQLKFQSLRFIKENADKYANILKHYHGTLNYDNIGQIHLPTPLSRPVPLSLRTNQYHPSQVNDLNNILNGIDKSSCMILLDGRPNFSPMSVVNVLFYY